MENICELPDVQCSEPKVKIPIKQVGVQNIELPFKLESKYGGHYQLNANVTMGVDLDENTKGISMSRLLLSLKYFLDLPLKRVLIKAILKHLRENVGGNNSFMRFEFRMPIIKKSILSDNRFPIYYKCKFEGQLIGDKFKFYQGVKIQYASYCPCSAELCKHLEETRHGSGFPHNQRSFADILVQVIDPNYVWLEEIIEWVEDSIKTLPYPIIKRIDEQEIARIAAENPLFVEDAVRIISTVLNSKDNIYDWIVKCTHEESIHTSEAIAINWKGVDGGLNGQRYI